MNETEALLEELTLSYEQLSLFYDWNEQFCSSSIMSAKLPGMLERLAMSSKSDAGLMVSHSKGSKTSILGAFCSIYETQQDTLSVLVSNLPNIEKKLETDFTINIEKCDSNNRIYAIIVPWRNDDIVLGSFIFTRQNMPYRYQENVLLGNACFELGVMYQNKSLVDSLRKKNKDTTDLLLANLNNITTMMNRMKNTWGAQANFTSIKEMLEHDYIEHLHHISNMACSMSQVHAKKLENMKIIAKIISEGLDYDDSKKEKLNSCVVFSDVSYVNNGDSWLANLSNQGIVGLTRQELDQFKEHPKHSAYMLSTVDKYADLAKIIACHHEQWDGMGFPLGLKGNEIPEISAIISMADTIAIKSEHHYKSVLELLEEPEVHAWLIKQAGKKFNPKLVLALFVGAGLKVPEDLEKYKM